MGAFSEAVAPARLGRSFRWLLASSWTSNLGDGIALAAGPLLVAALTRDAFLVSLAATVQWLPPMLFGLFAGAVTDRVDRRLLVVAVNGVRVVVLAVLTAALATAAVPIAAVLGALFLLGTAEVFADNATSTLLPTLVVRDDLAVGNARVQTGLITMNQLAGPPVGAALFTVGAAWAFGATAVLVALAAVLVSRISLPATGRDAGRPARLRADIEEGARWVRHHPAVRTLVITIFVFNLTFGAAWAVLVLYATQRLDLGEIGYGLVTTVIAAGGLLGTTAYGWITRRVSLSDLLRVGLVIETLTHLALALTRSPWVAMPVFFVFGVHAFVWGTTSITIRQRAVPRHLQGRVGSVNMVGTTGGLVIGSLLGGVLAQRYGVTAPFWFAFVGSAVFVVAIWRPLRHVAHADES
ncbi:MFS transporter [Geodermatophilaceae bacterium NBWT11]|nr:MFS transporter [Geodermatophilaceae bacterium NBWT11]